MSQQGAAIGPVGDESGTACARVARSERSIGQPRQPRRDHGQRKGQPDCGAHLGSNLSQQAVDPGTKHAARPVERHLPQPDGALKGRFAAHRSRRRARLFHELSL